MPHPSPQVIVVTTPEEYKAHAELARSSAGVSDAVAKELGRPHSGSPSHFEDDDDYFQRLQALGVSRDSLILELASIAMSRNGELIPLHMILEQSRISGAPIPDFETRIKELREQEKKRKSSMQVTTGNKISAIKVLLRRT